MEGNEFYVWFLTVIVLSFGMMLFGLVIAFVGIGMVRRSKAMLDASKQTNLLIAKQMRLILLHERLMVRWEKNLAVWYNDATGRVWAIDQEDKNLLSEIKKTRKAVSEQIDLNLQVEEPFES